MGRKKGEIKKERGTEAPGREERGTEAKGKEDWQGEN